MRNSRSRVGLAAGAAAAMVAVLSVVMLCAQQPSTKAASVQNDDPANLKGEQVTPLRGDEIAQNVGAKALWQNLLKLKTRASLLMIVAHPDDEDGGMLTYEVRGQGVRAAMLTLTRGEGGQNLMSADFNDALGLVRTEELLAADQYSGIEQMFGTEVDFGFCKSREEALQKWTHERVLYDAVRAVRLFRPLVVTSVFVGGPTDGHGHHQVAGEMAQEVYNAAADPKVFPEMGLPVWAPLKVYSRAPRSGVQGQQIYDSATGKTVPLRFFNYITQTWSDEVPPVNVVVHEGEVSDKLGMSYVQFAREGLGLQKTQIGNGVRRGGVGGAFDVGYHRWASRVPAKDTEQSFFDGVDVSLVGIAALAPGEKMFLPQGLAKLQALADAAVAGYQEGAPEKSAPVVKDALVVVRGLIAQVADAKDMSATERYDVLHELRAKEVQANDALAEAIGLQVEAKLVSAGPVVPGASLKVQTKVTENDPIIMMNVKVGDAAVPFLCVDRCAAAPSKGVANVLDVKVPAKEPLTRPYFSRPNFEQPYYNVSDARLRNAPRSPSPLVAELSTSYQGVEVKMDEVVQTMDDRPVTIVPALSVAVTPEVGILVPGEKTVRLKVHVRGDAGSGVNVRLKMPVGWSADPVSAPNNTKQMLSYDVSPGKATDAQVTVTAEAIANGRTYSEGYRIGGYDARTAVAVYTPSSYKTRAVDVKVAPGLRVGYLEGTGDDVPEYLHEMGVMPVMLKVSDLTAAGLAGLDTVVLGVRPFVSHADLGQAGPALMEFVRNGGTLVSQYDTAAVPEGLAPYAFVPGGNPGGVVVEENNKVVMTPVASPVMRWPNAITERDFDGWVEERGHGFARTFDPRYEAPLETHDAGQDPQHGGLLVAKVGNGYFVYCAFALYRQMPESVPGAYRLFANMLSLGKAPAGK